MKREVVEQCLRGIVSGLLKVNWNFNIYESNKMVKPYDGIFMS